MGRRSTGDPRYRKSRCKTVRRPKTFASVEAAKKYADANGIKKYKLFNMKSAESRTKKIRIEESE